MNYKMTGRPGFRRCIPAGTAAYCRQRLLRLVNIEKIARL